MKHQLHPKFRWSRPQDPEASAARRCARVEAEDAATWECRTCKTIIESGEYCRPCGSYWEDVRKGLWNDA